MPAKAAPRGEDGGKGKPGRIPLSTHSKHEGQGSADGHYQTPDALHVKYFHHFADTDGGETALHHTLGPNDGQASPGSHKHDGGSSPYLLDQFTISGVRGTSAYLQSIENALAAIGINITATG